jgi:hypothetical protein
MPVTLESEAAWVWLATHDDFRVTSERASKLLSAWRRSLQHRIHTLSPRQERDHWFPGAAAENYPCSRVSHLGIEFVKFFELRGLADFICVVMWHQGLLARKTKRGHLLNGSSAFLPRMLLPGRACRFVPAWPPSPVRRYADQPEIWPCLMPTVKCTP